MESLHHGYIIRAPEVGQLVNAAGAHADEEQIQIFSDFGIHRCRFLSMLQKGPEFIFRKSRPG